MLFNLLLAFFLNVLRSLRLVCQDTLIYMLATGGSAGE